MERMFAESTRFFAMPPEQKLKIKINRAIRGYVPPGASAQNISSVESANKRNQYESLMIRDELEPGAPEEIANNPMHGPNQWVDGLPGFKETCLEDYEVLKSLGRKFLPAFALPSIWRPITLNGISASRQHRCVFCTIPARNPMLKPAMDTHPIRIMAF